MINRTPEQLKGQVRSFAQKRNPASELAESRNLKPHNRNVY